MKNRKVLCVNDKDFCGYNDFIIGSKADEFVAGSYTHVSIKGSIISCEFVGLGCKNEPLIQVGEQEQ